MGKNSKPKGKGGQLGLTVGLGVIVAICILFALDKGKPKENGESALPEEQKDAKVQARALEEMAAGLEAAASADAAAFAAEARGYLAQGTLDVGLAQRPRWLPALAKRGTAPAPGVKNVVTLTSRTFFPEVAGSERMLVMFHSPHCVHCKNMEPHFKGAAKKGPDGVSFAMADTTKLNDISSAYNVSRLPTLLFYVHGRPTEARLPNATEKEILSYVNFRQESALTSLTAQELTELLAMPEVVEQSGMSKVVVLRGGEAAAQVLEDAAERARNRMIFLRVSDYEGAESSAEVITPATGDKVAFSGPWTYDACAEFLDAHATKPKASPPADEL